MSKPIAVRTYRVSALFALIFLLWANAAVAGSCTVNGVAGDCAPRTPDLWYCYGMDAYSGDTTVSPVQCSGGPGPGNIECQDSQAMDAIYGKDVRTYEYNHYNVCGYSWSWWFTSNPSYFTANGSSLLVSYSRVAQGTINRSSAPNTPNEACTPVTDNDQVNCNRDTHCPAGYAWQQDAPSQNWFCFASPVKPPDPDKNKGPCCDNGRSSPSTSNPIAIGTGNKYQSELDIPAGPGGLEFRRSYNSVNPSAAAVIGIGWQHNYNLRLSVSVSFSPFAQQAQALRSDGRVLQFVQTTTGSTSWSSDADVADRLVSILDGSGNVTGYQYFEANSDRVESYDAAGILTSINDSRRGLTFAFVYDAAQRLVSVTDRSGRALQFDYDLQSRVSDIWGPDGTAGDFGTLHWHYAYDANNNLQSVTTPANTTRVYAYENASFPNALTGITDENGTRYSTYGYDSAGRATSENLWSGTNQTLPVSSFALSFPVANQTVVTDPLGTQRTFQFEVVQGSVLFDSMSQTCTSAICPGYATTKSNTYDAAGYPYLKTDFNGNVTHYTYYDPLGLETQRVEASGTSMQRSTTTVWDTNLRLPVQRTVARNTGAVEVMTKWAYNSRGQTTARCTIDPNVSGASGYTCGSATNAPTGVRQWKYTYCDAVGTGCPLIGLLLSVDGPRTDISDVTTFAYYQTTDLSGCATLGGICHNLGDLQKVTNALGQITSYVSYDKNGRVTRMQDANGTFTDMTYHARGWLLTRTVRANADGTPNPGGFDITTTFAYDNVGNVTKVTQAEGDYVRYTYDNAHRLTDITDTAGNHIHYQLDAAGNRTSESTYDTANALKRSLSRQYDQLDHLLKVLNAASATVQTYANPAEAPPSGITYTNGYDGNGNAVYSTDGNANHVGTEQQYDPLNRLIKTLQDHAGTGATHDTTTQYAYDTRDNLRSVTDPSSLVTSYTYDGLNSLTALTSPDTGATTYTYDAAGNRKTQTDARGVTSTYSYDALNRLTGISYPTTSLNVTYAYDAPASGCFNAGQLTSFSDNSGSTTYCYNRRGGVIKKTQITNGITLVTGYVYTRDNLLSNITYPSGASVFYWRDTTGRVNLVTYKANVNSATVNVLSSISYYPFGPMNVLTYGNGRTLTKTYDRDYAIDTIVGTAPVGFTFDGTVDVMGNLVDASYVLGASPPYRRYAYDPLYRLTNVSYEGSNATVEFFSYNASGDRLSKILGPTSSTYAYAPGTHHLSSVAGVARSYDANGNTTGLGAGTATYDDRNRLVSSSVGVSYNYNGRGERVFKTGKLFSYDEAGRVLGEYTTAGALGAEYIYVDSVPVAYVTGGVLYYVETDQLGTPRNIVQPGATPSADTRVWNLPYFSSDSAFAETPPSPATITFNLRFPGQYYDSETGLNYNYFRDYEPGTGRYVESDPISLYGGINTYGYVDQNPLGYRDSKGLAGAPPRPPNPRPRPFTPPSPEPPKPSDFPFPAPVLPNGPTACTLANIFVTICPPTWPCTVWDCAPKPDPLKPCGKDDPPDEPYIYMHGPDWDPSKDPHCKCKYRKWVDQ